MKYDLLNEKHRLDLDNKKLEVEKGFIEITKERNQDQFKFSKDNNKQQKRLQEDKMLWESEKIGKSKLYL